ncbi:MAG: bifunctional pyr operon transcriptional regulator/uracil phosphoribosyltransferase, partial [Nitrospinae bacterium]|nr:bifunctional pyr operon transcriptional regulator/uracil phosphoribosyltransferase [Nitrospinota bacterium]
MPNVIFNAEDINRAITRIAHEILEKNKGSENLALVGIRTRGVYLAQRLIRKLNEFGNKEPPLGILA